MKPRRTRLDDEQQRIDIGRRVLEARRNRVSWKELVGMMGTSRHQLRRYAQLAQCTIKAALCTISTIEAAAPSGDAAAIAIGEPAHDDRSHSRRQGQHG